MRIGAGCGVVKDSVLDKEWEEIQLKIKAIRTFLSL
jgi:menaquinone-specific isochorismate synthase